MYTYSSAVGLLNRDWFKIDITSVKLKEVFSRYTEVRVVLNHVALSGPVEMSLSSLRGLMIAEERTILEWLTEHGGSRLPTYTETTDVYTRYQATYNDCYNLNLSIKPTDITKHVDTELPRDLLPDLFITGENVNYASLNSSALFMVNGLIHPSFDTDEGIYIKHGDISSRVSNKASVGFLDFSTIGNIERHQITYDMFYTPNNDVFPRVDGVFLDTGLDLTGKTLMLILGGTLHVLDGSYSQLGGNRVKLNLTENDYIKLIDISRNFLGEDSWLSEILQLNVLDKNKALSDEYIGKLLTSDFSGLLTLDRDDLCMYRVPIAETGIPYAYTSEHVPYGLLMSGTGIHGNYVIRKEQHIYHIYTNWINNSSYNVGTTTLDTLDFIDFTISTLHKTTYSNAYILNLYTLTGSKFMTTVIKPSSDDGEVTYGDVAPLHHRHQISDIDGLEATIADIQSNIHSHDISDIDGLVAELALMNERLRVIDGGSY